MSALVTAIEAEFAKAETGLSEIVSFFTGKAQDAIKARVAELEADEEKLKGDLKAELEKAKAAALADVQANEPAAANAVNKAVTALEAAIVSALEAHLVP